MTLNVYFVDNDQLQGTACLIENIITGDVKLELPKTIFVNEIDTFIEKSKKILLLRYENVKVNINWDKLVVYSKEEK